MKNWNALVVSLWCGKYNFKEVEFFKDSKIYRTFGNHDSITIAPVFGEDSTQTLTNMWSKTVLYSNNIKAGESIHNYFAISDNPNCKAFWESDFPYLFVSSIQVKFNILENFDEQINGFKNEIFSLLNNSGYADHFNFELYNSLGSEDILLFIKTNTYIEGANLIRKISVESTYEHYNYSVCGMNVDTLLDDLENNTEVIPKVVVCSVLDNVIKYKEWFNEFKKEYPYELKFESLELSSIPTEEYVHLARIGNEDICINIYNCNMKHFLKMFLNKSGVFYYDNALVKQIFSRLRIQFDTTLNVDNERSHRDSNNGKSLINLNASKLKKVLSNSASAYVYKAISEVLAAAENLETKKFAFDVQDCIRNVFPLFVSKVSSFDDKHLGFNQNQFDKDVILFTTGLLSIANGSLHADKLFINVPGFNAVPCDVPAKLLVYYTAYIQKLVDILNDSEIYNYRFLLCPDLYLGIEIVSLFNYFPSDSQLLKARIPIKRLFEPKSLLMELSHEVAHYVGVTVRARNVRVKHLTNAISYIFADRLLRPKMIQPIKDGSVYAKENLEAMVIQKFMPSNIKSIDYMLENNWSGVVKLLNNKLNIDSSETETLYLSSLKNRFYEKAQLFLSAENFSQLLNEIYDIVVAEKLLDIPDDAFAFGRIVNRHKDLILLDECKSIIISCCDLFSEAFADLVMLYITEEPNEYLYNIYISEKNTSFNNGVTDICSWHFNQAGRMKFERIISVFKALNYSFDKIDYKEDQQFKDYVECIEKYSHDENEFSREVPLAVVNSTSSYLKECLNELKSKSDQLDIIKALFKSTSKKDLFDFVEQFGKEAFQFRLDLIKTNHLDN